jgi:hypothetical protein
MTSGSNVSLPSVVHRIIPGSNDIGGCLSLLVLKFYCGFCSEIS